MQAAKHVCVCVCVCVCVWESGAGMWVLKIRLAEKKNMEIMKKETSEKIVRKEKGVGNDEEKKKKKTKRS